MISTQSMAQQHTTTKTGSDINNPQVEQVFDDVTTMEHVLSYYKIEESKLTPTKENYQFWVSFLKENKISTKRKGIIREVLGNMKQEISQ